MHFDSLLVDDLLCYFSKNITTVIFISLELKSMLKPICPKQVVVVMAHPDDAELTCFGTLLSTNRAR